VRVSPQPVVIVRPWSVISLSRCVGIRSP
jgi:hypothetical protein